MKSKTVIRLLLLLFFTLLILFGIKKGTYRPTRGIAGNLCIDCMGLTRK